MELGPLKAEKDQHGASGLVFGFGCIICYVCYVLSKDLGFQQLSCSRLGLGCRAYHRVKLGFATHPPSLESSQQKYCLSLLLSLRRSKLHWG